MPGLVGLGRQTLKQAESSFSRAADLERNRNNQNEQLEQAADAAQKQSALSGAGMGAAIGLAAEGATALSVAGTAGIGSLAGLLINELL